MRSGKIGKESSSSGGMIAVPIWRITFGVGPTHSRAGSADFLPNRIKWTFKEEEEEEEEEEFLSGARLK